MFSRHVVIRNVREALGLPLPSVAKAAGLDESYLAALENGGVDPSIDEIEALSRVLGMHGDDLLEEMLPGPPSSSDSLRMLLKSAEVFRPSPEVRLRMVRAGRAALDLLEFREEIGVFERVPFPAEKTQPRPVVAGRDLYEQGQDLAQELRRTLQINGPILSMRDFITGTFGIPLIGSRLTADGPEAFTVYAPGKRLAIVINLDGRNRNSWVRRFSLAHELCHALYDRPGSGPLGIACWQQRTRSIEIETRANGFAVRLILPAADLRSAARDKGLFEARVLRGLMEIHGLHRGALELDARKHEGLSADEAKIAFPEVDPSPTLVWRSAEELPAEREAPGEVPEERLGELALVVLHAYQGGLISRSRVRELLGVGAVAPIGELAQYLGIDAPELA